MKRYLQLMLVFLALGVQAQVKFVKTVNTVSDLQNLQPDDIHDVVFVKGYASAAAADGAKFVYDATSAAATNTVNVFKPTSVTGNGRWLRQDQMFQAGSTTVPSITFGLDPNTGFANSASDQLDIINGGTLSWSVLSGGTLQANGAKSITTSSGALTAAPSGNLILSPGGTTKWTVASTGNITGSAGYGTITGGTGVNLALNSGAATDHITLGIGSVEKSRVTTNGNLLIGSTTDLTGSGGIRAAGTTEATTGGVGAVVTAGGIYSAKKIVGNTDLIVNTSLVYADSATSKVGIGTTGPDRKLDILDASNPQLRLTQTDGTVFTDVQTSSSGHTIITNTFGTRLTTPVVNDTAVLARQVQGGLAFDGVTAGAKDYHAIAAVGTSDISVKWSGILPSSNPTVTGILFSMSANTGTVTVANSFYAAINTTGQLDVFFWGATTPTDYIRVLYSNIIATYGGKAVDIVFVRDATTPSMTVYINGVALSGGSEANGGVNPTWAMSINSTYFTLSQQAGNTPLNVTVYGATLFNRALSASEVITLANQGVQEADKWGSLTARYTSDFSAGVNGWISAGGLSSLSAPVTAGVTANTLEMISDATTGQHRTAKSFSAVVGKRYQVTYSYYMPVSSNVTAKRFVIYDAGINIVDSVAAPADSVLTTRTFGFTSVNGGTLQIYMTDASGAVSFAGTSGDRLYIYNVTITQIGSILDADLSAGVGYQVPDRSSNNSHGLVSTSGTTWTLPRTSYQAKFKIDADGYLGDTTSRACIPGNARIESITAYNTSNTPTFTVGDDSAAAANINAGIGPLTVAQGTDVPLLKRFATTGTDGRIYIDFTAGTATGTVFTIEYTVPANY